MHKTPLPLSPIKNYRKNPLDPWSSLELFLPHKIFLWDNLGTYRDVEYPNPIYGHLYDLHSLQGKSVTQVLPKTIGEQVLGTIQQVLHCGGPQYLVIPLSRKNGRHFHVLLRLFPLSHHVWALANDFPALSFDSWETMNSAIHHPKALSRHPLTFGEQRIILAMGMGLPDTSITTQFKISERTLKFHQLNLCRKLGLRTRECLRILAPIFLGKDPFPPN